MADGKAFTDPEVLRRLTSSVSCALDEAAAALTRMRSQNNGLPSSAGQTTADGNNVTEVQVRNWAMSMCCVPGQNTLLSVSLSLPKSINRCQCNEMLEVRGSSNASSCFMLSELR